MGPRIKWKLKETSWALFAFYYGKLKWLHNSGLKWAQHGMKIDVDFRLTSCWFMTRLVGNFPDSVTGSNTQSANTYCTLSSTGWCNLAAQRLDKDLCSRQKKFGYAQKRPRCFLTPPPPTLAMKTNNRKSRISVLVLGRRNYSQKPFVNLLCLSGIN